MINKNIRNKIFIFIAFILFLLLGFYFLNSDKELENTPSVNGKDNIVIDKSDDIGKKNSWELIHPTHLDEKEDELEIIEFYEKQLSDFPVLINTVVNWYLNYAVINDKPEYAEKVLRLLENYDENYDTLFFKWFAYEVAGSYDKALEIYNSWLDLEWITDRQKSDILNRQWYVYELKWDKENTIKYYMDAYSIVSGQYVASYNVWRYFWKLWICDKALPFLEYALNTDNSILKLDIYNLLSKWYLKEWDNYSVEKSYNYAIKAVELNPDDYLWYIRIAENLIEKKNKEDYKKIEENLLKSMELNPNGYLIYYTMWVYNNLVWNEDDAIADFKKSLLMFSKKWIWTELNDSSEKWKINYQLSINYSKKENSWITIFYIKWLIKDNNEIYFNKVLEEINKKDSWVYNDLKWNEDFNKYIIELKK